MIMGGGTDVGKKIVNNFTSDTEMNGLQIYYNVPLMFIT